MGTSSQKSLPDPTQLWEWLSLDVEALRRTCEFQAYQAQGPGGQKRNRVYSGMRAVHSASGLQAQAHDRREAERNRITAIRRLREHLAAAFIPHLSFADPALPERARVWLQAMKEPIFRPVCSEEHEDFPRHAVQALLALAVTRGALPFAAVELGCTSSALARFLKRFSPGWQWLMLGRKSLGQPALH
jgi:hypothetical protein